MGRIIGIDLGTTYSLAAVMDGDRPVILANAEDGRLTPSVVALLDGSRPLVGQLAKRQAAANPERTVFSAKRRLGRRDGLGRGGNGANGAGDVIESIKRHMGSDLLIKRNGRRYTPEEISAMVLRKLKEDVETRLGETVDKAVITVPAYFNDNQRRATRLAGRLAGLKVVRLLSEPTAAALAYGIAQEDIQTVLVWDLGGGTFDVSILELGRGFFQVKAVSGDPRLGGDDYDLRIAEHLADEFLKKRAIELREDKSAWQRLKEAAQAAKIELSGSETARVRVPLLERDACLDREITRREFEALTGDLALRMAPPTRQALADAGLAPKDIDRVLLVGGSTRMPTVRRLAAEVLGREPHPHTVDPDEAVALGAAIQAGVLSGGVKDVVLVDVTPLSLGIETQGGICARLIERNTPIPVTRGRLFTTAEDDQTSVEVHILQGERALAKDNMRLGRFRLEGIEPQPRGEARVEVGFEIDADGIVRVSATDLQTETQRRVEIASLDGVPAGEVRQLLEEARAHAGEDRRKKEALEAGIRADSMIHAAELAIREALKNGAASAGLKERLDDCERAVMALKKVMGGGDIPEIRAKTTALEERIKALSRKEPAAAPQQRVEAALPRDNPRSAA